MLAWTAWMLIHAGGGVLTGSAAPFPALLWHAHEMLFGYAIAVLAGFLLTASANWAKEGPVAGRRLMLLVALWLAGRLAQGFGDALPWIVADLIDLAFLPALALTVAGTLWRAESRRNLIFLPILGVFFTADLLVHLEVAGAAEDTAYMGLTLAVDGFAFLMTMIGGRLTPGFTANALKAQGIAGTVRDPKALAAASGAAVLAVLVLDLAAPGSGLAGTAAALAAIVLLARLAFWQTPRTANQPILWVLHLGYLWIAVGMALKAAAVLGDAIPASAAAHALTTGAVGVYTLGMMSRVGLGHTGRPLEVRPAIAMAYGLVSIAAVMRIAAPVLFPDLYFEAIAVAGGLWIVAFATFTALYWPILTRPRVDGKPG